MILFALALACAPSDQDVSPTDPGQDSVGDPGGGDPDPGHAPGGDGGGDGGDGGDGGGDDGAGDDGDDPGEYVHEEEELEPGLSLGEVEEAIELGIQDYLDVDPLVIFDAFYRTLEDGDGDCPYINLDYKELYGYDYWYGGCTSDRGDDYAGSIYGINYAAAGPYVSGYYRYDNYAWWYGDYGVQYADGQSFDLTGYLYFYQYEYTYYGYTAYYSNFYGTILWEGPDYAHTWLGDEVSYTVVSSGLGYPGAAASYINLDGGIARSHGDTTAVEFDGVYLAHEGYGSSCDREPSGVIGVRDSDGEWYQVMFDGPAYADAEVFPPDCDGCGDVWYRGENLGQACVDFSPLLGWEVHPWAG